MSDASNAKKTPRLQVVVSDVAEPSTVPDNIDSDLYTEPERNDSRVEFTIEPDDELVEVLRANGHEVDFEQET